MPALAPPALGRQVQPYRHRFAGHRHALLGKQGKVAQAQSLGQASADKSVARGGKAQHAHVGQMGAEFAEAEVVRAKGVALVRQSTASAFEAFKHGTLSKARAAYRLSNSFWQFELCHKFC